MDDFSYKTNLDENYMLKFTMQRFEDEEYSVKTLDQNSNLYNKFNEMKNTNTDLNGLEHIVVAKNKVPGLWNKLELKSETFTLDSEDSFRYFKSEQLPGAMVILEDTKNSLDKYLK